MGTMITELSETLDISPARIRRIVDKLGLEPTRIHSRCWVFTDKQAKEIAKAILRETQADAQTRAKCNQFLMKGQ